MTPDKIFWALALLLFIAACVFYRLKREIGGDRLMFLASGMILCCVFALVERLGFM